MSYNCTIGGRPDYNNGRYWPSRRSRASVQANYEGFVPVSAQYEKRLVELEARMARVPDSLFAFVTKNRMKREFREENLRISAKYAAMGYPRGCAEEWHDSDVAAAKASGMSYEDFAESCRSLRTDPELNHFRRPSPVWVLKERYV